MAKNANPYCCADVRWATGVWGSTSCSRKGTICRNGKWYCKQHDPEAVEARAKASKDKSDAMWKAEREQVARRKAEQLACDGVPTDQLRPGLMAKLLEADDEQQ